MSWGSFEYVALFVQLVSYFITDDTIHDTTIILQHPFPVHFWSRSPTQ